MVDLEAELKALMVRSLGGDSAAYAVLLRRLGDHLRAYYQRRLGRAADAEDLLQETLIAMHTRRSTYDVTRPFTAWVHAIARYKIIDLLRRRSRNEMLNDPLDDEDQLFVAVDGDAAEARYDLKKLLDELPDRQRLPIVYVKIEGASVADAAKRTGMSESAVKVGIHRGLKALAAKIGNIE